MEKNSKKVFLGICTGPNTLFLDYKIFRKIFELHLVPGTTFNKNFFKTKVEPGTKYRGLPVYLNILIVVFSFFGQGNTTNI
jgi:hypothetical protein